MTYAKPAMLLDFPPPVAFGLPDRFQSWRPHQIAAWQQIVDAPTRFVAVTAPTGSGKSLIYMTALTVEDLQWTVVTGGKGLQDQVGDEFKSLDLVDVRGQANYPCAALAPDGEWAILRGDHVKDHSCQNGPCHVGLPCSHREAGCGYYDTVRMATERGKRLTNYAFWLHQRRWGVGLGQTERLVLDEAHEADSELSGALQIKLEKWLCQAIYLDVPENLGSVADWQKWAVYHANKYKAILDTSVTGKSAKEMKHRKRLQMAERTLRTMGGMHAGDWVDDHTPDAYVFDCLYPHNYAEPLLFQGAKKVVLTSATLTPKTLALLGIKPSDVTWFECPSHFPIERRPVTWVPTVKVDFRMTPAHRKQWVVRIDQIAMMRPDVKGIIHTVSYDRAKYLLANSALSSRMLLPHQGGTQATVDLFRKTTEPRILVSPAVATGWDFPGDQCRFQILAKLPFPDTRSKFIQARQALDKDYGAYLMMQQLVQAVGRGMRSETDWCENVIVDDNWAWVQKKYKAFAPSWFWEATGKSLTVPKPLSFAA